MYKWLENIDLSSFSAQIEDFVNHLVDPASLMIPDDPVFVSYRQFEQLRLMSANSLLEMSKQMEESRQYIAKVPQDKSEIALVVQNNHTDKSYETELKNILRFLVEEGKDKAQIRMICNAINGGLIMAHMVAKQNEEAAMTVINRLKQIGDKNIAPLVDEYWKILQSSDKTSGFKLLPQYLEELITQQAVELESHRKKLRDDRGEDLTKEEVICPLTRQVINANNSLATQHQATQFMMLIVVLAHLANIKNSELDEFISTQELDYVSKCFELLQRYVKNPEQLPLTRQHHEFLNQLGMNKVLQQWQMQSDLDHSAEKTEDTEKSGQQTSLNSSEIIKNNSVEKPQQSPGSCRFFKLVSKTETTDKPLGYSFTL
ncbi:hypothetical protein [Legionella longbeachae]|uniref:Uncharacterized protein n=1 Tax=Legionella longbeachae serogroup 1 (strain NSW150) TaxID=661367 RepID=D3HMN0_LEGLN|nr:hypothetical protein [Legionella longbeachae]VEE04231.1 Uncharacterised protein [Legionella oakridgensis]HBD7397001.1 hypothetical protein [Legionella pneumophila]ARB92941.1 hypothetical protein A6J40_12460 [Legionella longbeachae]ARM33919.1 hypothetical protein B0B39_10460 [Legionella longbeachae]EEZ96879.1 hypothetical protein LLB_2077 [Legionella longbeachae D-4968]